MELIDTIDRQKYYDAAWILLARAGVENVEVDEKFFCIVKKEKVKVHVVKFDKSTVSDKELRRLKAIPNYHSIYDRKMKWDWHKGDEPIFEIGYFEFDVVG